MAHDDRFNARHFRGKTIARVDARAVNVVRFHFTDGTSVAVEVEAVGSGIYGMVTCTDCAEPRKGKAA